MLSPKNQLIQIAKLVEQWQQTKSYRNTPVPAQLRQQIIALFEHFSYTKVKDNLNMSKSLLYRWWQEYQGKQIPTETQPSTQESEFIELPPSCNVQEQGISLELSLNNQCQMRLTGNVSTQQLDVVTRNIFMYQSGHSS